jgi:leader peptidase (prepilin peptidase) / N-methyltransferase
LTTDLLFAVLGLCVGNLINLVAIHSISDKPWLVSGLCCDECGHQLGFADQIPLLSFLACAGHCRYCKRAISWQFPLVELGTAFMFVAFIHKWQPGWYLMGMLTLGCTLMVATVTDIRTRLIPHDITYPSMLCGVLFSALVRNDLFGALAGMGISYLIFDFLAHYGLKLYLAWQPKILHQEISGSNPGLIGGADAVLAAVIASWLGCQRLIVALLVSIVVGTLIGISAALHEVYTHGNLKKVMRKGLLGAVIGLIALTIPIALMYVVIPDVMIFTVIAGLFGVLLGFVCGVLSAGNREQKPFPFGPALAVGGFVAMFYQSDQSIRL